MTNDPHPPEPLPEEIDPIGPGEHVPNPEPLPEDWEKEEIDPDAEDRPSPKSDEEVG